jgi:hypothetical protein
MEVLGLREYVGRFCLIEAESGSVLISGLIYINRMVNPLFLP